MGVHGQGIRLTEDMEKPRDEEALGKFEGLRSETRKTGRGKGETKGPFQEGRASAARR